ncbi:hypothetical protein Csa_007665 [Cucumis sativus]|nr:hypothetical protein Csa_007665 [Cucumis sativus]
MHHNKMKWTACEFFYKTHEKMLNDAEEWLKKTSESCSAVAVLVATVVFAAAYTVPGGLNSKTGSPVLLTEPIYIVFTIMDIIALATALTGEYNDGIRIDDCVDNKIEGDEVDDEFVIYCDISSGDHVYYNSTTFVCGVGKKYMELSPKYFQVSSHGFSCFVLGTSFQTFEV